MMLVIVLSSLAIIGAPGTYGYSKNVWDLVSFMNGDWDNKDQIDVGEGGHDFVEASWVPVEVPALGSDPVMLVEQAVNGVIQIFNLAVFTDGPGNSVTLKLYYGFTDISNIKPRSYNTEQLSQLKLEDLHSDDDCFASFLITPKGIDIGDYAYCSYTFNGKHPRFTFAFTCDGVAVVFPIGTNQQSTAIPYYFPRKDFRYPLKNLPEGYVSQCN